MNDELKKILEDLKNDYLRNLPAKLEMIEGLWKSGDIDKLETEFHKLKGTGKTYGLPEISELGLCAEELCSAPPATRDQAVPLALCVLRQIHSTRLKGQEFDLTTSDLYKTLADLKN